MPRQLFCARPALARLLLSALVLSPQLMAQTMRLEEVLVTAQKRTENVQEVPFTVSVLEGRELDQFTIRDTNDLADAVPGLTIQHTPQNLSQIAIRGLGTGAGSESVDQSVGLFIDGVWAGRIREFQTSLFDVQRIEVIKGTQTTLLGKNTSLGAVSILSRRPGTDFGGYIQTDYEFEFNSYYATGAVDLPTDAGNYRLAFNAVNEEGYVSNRATGNKVPEREQNTLRASGLWDVGAQGALLLMYQWDDLEIRGDSFQPDEDGIGFIQSMDPATDIGIDTNKNAFTSYSSHGDSDDQQESQRALLEYGHSFGAYTLTALTGWSKYSNDRLTDSDFLQVDYLTTAFASDYEQISQEVRIASPTDAAFNYIVGAYYLDSELDYAGITDASFPVPFTFAGLPLDSSSRVNYTQDTQVMSLFGQGTVEFSDTLRATVGLRYTDEEKDAVFSRDRLRLGSPIATIVSDLIAPIVPPTALQRSEDNLDASINIQYDIGDTAMAFVSWARGSKSGGFDVSVARPEEAEYDTEEAETCELGVKSTLAGGAALLNVSLFYTEIDDFQVTSFVGDSFLTETVPAQTRGVELEGQFAVSERLMFGVNATYADGEDKVNNIKLPYAPELSASLKVRYDIPWRAHAWLWRIDGSINYRDEQYQQRLERSLDGDLTLFNLRIALLPDNERWELALLGRNLLDQASSFGFDFPFWGGGDFPEGVPLGSTTIGSLNRPRTIALQGRLNF